MSQLELALFVPQSGSLKGQKIPVHFNPVSLQYTVSNTLQEQGKEKKQYVTKSTAKLTMDLIFDTTHNGEDVRITTEKLARFMEPDKKHVPPLILFEWGTYTFKGMLESYKETLDFFASNGVPLRAAVNLTLSKQDKVFESSPHPPADQSVAGGNLASNEPVVVPTGDQNNATKAATQGGDPRAGRGLAAANGASSMRFLTTPVLAVGGSIPLGGPVAFASGSAGAGIGGGLSAGAGAGFGVSAGASASAGFGASASASASVSANASASASASIGASASAFASASTGALASAGVSAGAGAFAGLRVSSSSQTVSLDTSKFLPQSGSAQLSIGGAVGGDFRLGGQASAGGSAGLKADVGATASLKSRIQF